MRTTLNWRLMTQKGRIDERIDELFDTAFIHRDMAAYDNMTVLGWNALDHDVPLPENPATPWLAASRVDWVRDRQPEQVAAPKIEVTQVPSGLLIELRLPRLVRESVYIGVRDNILTVTGEQAVPAPIEAAFGQSGRRFQRNFPLPPVPGRHRINAYCHGEVLRIIVSGDNENG
ncbi:MAG: Hsp20/alpha crystallin family protein [Pseudomonadota bacterium]